MCYLLPRRRGGNPNGINPQGNNANPENANQENNEGGGGNNGGGFLVQIIHHIAGGFVQIIPQTAHGAGPLRY